MYENGLLAVYILLVFFFMRSKKIQTKNSISISHTWWVWFPCQNDWQYNSQYYSRHRQTDQYVDNEPFLAQWFQTGSLLFVTFYRKRNTQMNLIRHDFLNMQFLLWKRYSTCSLPLKNSKSSTHGISQPMTNYRMFSIIYFCKSNTPYIFFAKQPANLNELSLSLNMV